MDRLATRRAPTWAEMFAIHTPDELKTVLDRIEAESCGKPIGEQMLADAHG